MNCPELLCWIYINISNSPTTLGAVVGAEKYSCWVKAENTGDCDTLEKMSWLVLTASQGVMDVSQIYRHRHS